MDRDDGEMWQGARTMYLVKRLEMQLRSVLEPVVRSVGLTVPQYTALTIIEARPGTSSAEVARSTFVSAQAANQIVEALYTRRLVSRAPNPDHGKILSLTVTPAGDALLAACSEEISAIERRMLGALKKPAAQDFHHNLRACIDALAE